MTSRAWLQLVTAAPRPTDPGELRRLAHVANARLDAIESALGDSLTTEQLVTLLQELTVARPALDAAGLERPHAFWSWLAPLFTWREGPPWSEILGPQPPCRFHAIVTDGRDDLVGLWAPDQAADEDEAAVDGPSTTARPLPPELERLRVERVAEWVHVAHLGDGHRDLFWDRSSTPGVRVLLTDDRELEVVTDEWPSAAAFLTGWFLPRAVEHFRPGVTDAMRGASTGRALAVLVGLGAMVLGAVAVIGVLLRGCGVL